MLYFDTEEAGMSTIPVKPDFVSFQREIYRGVIMNLGFAKLINRILLIFSLFVWAACTHADERGIEVTGTAKVNVVPDMATFSFSINDRGKILEVLKGDIDKKTASVVGLCKEIGVEARNITSSEVSIRPQYNYQTKKFIGYDVSRNITVILNNLEKYTALVNGAIKSGITTIGNIALDVKDRDELERKALGSAIEAAKKKAEILAKSSGVSLGDVINVKEGGVPIERDAYRFKQRASADAVTKGAFEPGEISVTATVVVKYSIN